MGEVLDFRQRERLCEKRHPFLEFGRADDANAVDLGETAEHEFRLFPAGCNVPAVDVLHNNQQTNASAAGDFRVDYRQKVLVVFG